ncbi:MAG: YhcH/YjgK/YiaL family protein [Actinobacteria bacterium]|nr:YhcH/YjgK/YiaL family protein [Actinomycetota bacterium]
MITGKFSKMCTQLNYLEDKRILKAFNLIESLNFPSLPDNIFEIEGKNFYYILSSYQTTTNIKEKPAEAHRKYLDLQYIIYGKEKIGFADYSNIKKAYSEYNPEKDIEFFDSIDNECFITLSQNHYAIFFPEDIHRPGISINNPINVRKVVFKFLIGINKLT